MSDQLANQGDTDTETIAYATQTEQDCPTRLCTLGSKRVSRLDS